MPIRLTARGADELARLIARIERHSHELPYRCEEALRGTALTVVPAVSDRVSGIEIVGNRDGQGRPKGNTGLRNRLAAAVGTADIDEGVRIEVDGSAVDPVWGDRLARLSDYETVRKWSHPVFYRPGRRRVWTDSAGEPWFGSTIRAHQERFSDAIERVVQRTADAITRGN